LNSLSKHVCCALIVFAGAALQAQTADTCQTRNVVVNVRDKSGKLIVGLPPEAFRVTLHGQTLKVLSSKVEIAPRRVVLVLDASGSMTGDQGSWYFARVVAQNMVFSPDVVRMALVVFARDVLEVMDFSHTPKEIFSRITQLSDGQKFVPPGRHQTALRDAILSAANLMGTQRPGDAIYAITDGDDNSSHVSIERLERELTARGTRFFAVVFENAYFPIHESLLRGVLDMKDLARNTGGWGVVAEAVGGIGFRRLAPALQQLYDQITDFYQLAVSPPSSLKKETQWSIDLVDSRGQKRKDVTVYFPRELPPCVTRAIKQ
jgi:hypothetical protein